MPDGPRRLGWDEPAPADLFDHLTPEETMKPRTQRLKVYGIDVVAPREWQSDDHNPRAIVAAPSRAAAARAFCAAGVNISVGFLAAYGMESGNETEVQLTTRDPGTVYFAGHGSREYRAVP